MTKATGNGRIYTMGVAKKTDEELLSIADKYEKRLSDGNLTSEEWDEFGQILNELSERDLWEWKAENISKNIEKLIKFIDRAEDEELLRVKSYYESVIKVTDATLTEKEQRLYSAALEEIKKRGLNQGNAIAEINRIINDEEKKWYTELEYDVPDGNIPFISHRRSRTVQIHDFEPEKVEWGIYLPVKSNKYEDIKQGANYASQIIERLLNIDVAKLLARRKK